MYKKAYEHLAGQVESMIAFAGQHNTDIYIAAVEKNMRHYIQALDMYVSLPVGNVNEGRAGLAKLVNCLSENERTVSDVIPI